MAESSYNSKGEKMAWDDREIIAQFLCRDEAAIKILWTSMKDIAVPSPIVFWEMERMSGSA